MKRIILICLLCLFGCEVFSQTGYYVVQAVESIFGVDTIHYYIGEDCFFGRRQMPDIAGKKFDEYYFVDFKSGKKKMYIIFRNENKIPIITPDFLDFVDSIDSWMKVQDSIKSEEDKMLENRLFFAEGRKPIKPKKNDTLYVVSCKDAPQMKNVLSYSNIPTKNCIATLNTGRKIPITIATDITIPSVVSETAHFTIFDVEIGGNAILEATTENMQRRTIFIKEFTIKEQDKQRLLSAEYDADIIGSIQYILRLSIPIRSDY